MSTDYKGELVAAVRAALEASTPVKNFFKLANRDDERAAGVPRNRHKSDPASFPNLIIQLGAGSQAITTTPTFGVAQALTLGDPIIPETVDVEIVMEFDTTDLDKQTPQESAVHAALMAGYPKLGKSYVRMFTIRGRRQPHRKKPNQIKVTMTLSFELRMRLSQLV
jgi:hypothetical protein